MSNSSHWGMFVDILLWVTTVQVLIGVGLGLLCAFLIWRGPRDSAADQSVPAALNRHRADPTDHRWNLTTTHTD
ncbi:hypothetical protein GCM10008959_20080 [Deinococcus seoulensis]|uniref:Uncharacterized protein n=2 Tax=Deinococcus seoulensis TaxID=1837379 RepID=A0ABQ2RUP2_9DEIO|nr:hypothetical protein GCM10008959_20080 [Deinococcus seoulensis]